MDVRAADAAILSLQGPVPALPSASDLTIPVSGGLGGRLYRPAPGPLPVLLYLPAAAPGCHPPADQRGIPGASSR
ncbi:MAG TPA: hypothetical protein VGG16_23470 [Streptosporangiaceae bacterium]